MLHKLTLAGLLGLAIAGGGAAAATRDGQVVKNDGSRPVLVASDSGEAVEVLPTGPMRDDDAEKGEKADDHEDGED